jgi:hypothetical protein
MRTLKFSSVIYGVSQLAGLDRDNLPNHFFKQVRDLANHRLGIAWETEYWPDLLRISELAVTTTGDVSTITYPTDAGEILEVHNKNPRKTTLNSSVGFLLYDDGTDSDTNSGKTINVFATTSPLYVEYRIARPTLTGDSGYSASTVYEDDTQIYYPTTGHFYTRKNQSGTPPGTETGVAPTVTTDWDKALVPKIFENYLIRGVYADYLRSSGQTDAASREDQNAEGFLVLESDKLYRQQGQVRTTKVVTY